MAAIIKYNVNIPLKNIWGFLANFLSESKTGRFNHRQQGSQRGGHASKEQHVQRQRNLLGNFCISAWLTKEDNWRNMVKS